MNTVDYAFWANAIGEAVETEMRSKHPACRPHDAAQIGVLREVAAAAAAQVELSRAPPAGSHETVTTTLTNTAAFKR